MRAKVYGSMRERRCVRVYDVWVSECGYEQKKRERERETGNKDSIQGKNEYLFKCWEGLAKAG